MAAAKPTRGGARKGAGRPPLDVTRDDRQVRVTYSTWVGAGA